MSEETTLLRGLIQHIKEKHKLIPIRMGRPNNSEIQGVEYNSCDIQLLENVLMVTPKSVTVGYSSASVMPAQGKRMEFQYSDPSLIPNIESLLILPGKDTPVNIADLRKDIGDGRYLIMGDPHGCLKEVKALLEKVNFDPQNDFLITVGDLIDKGPKSRKTVEFFMGLPHFHTVKGNHDDKFLRLMFGHPVKVTNSMQETIDDFGGVPSVGSDVFNLFREMPYIIRVPAGYVVHAGFNPVSSTARASAAQTTKDCLYTRYVGGANNFDDIGGTYWSTKWDWKYDTIYRSWEHGDLALKTIFHGHEPHDCPAPFQTNGCINLDGGCAFGGRLWVWDSQTSGVECVKGRAYADSGRKCWISGSSSSIIPKTAKKETKRWDT